MSPVAAPSASAVCLMLWIAHPRTRVSVTDNTYTRQPKGTEDYVPAGVMAVPRSQQVSVAVFEQEENLKAVSGNFVFSCF